MASDADRTRRLTPVERLERDVITVLSRPAMVADFWTDLTEAEMFVRKLADEGSADVTMTVVIIKAAALAALASPNLHRMYGPFRALDPAHADVGVSVASRTMLAPVVVIPRADMKSLDQIAGELRAKSADARRRKPGDAAFARSMALVPFPLRRAFIRWWLLSPKRRRRTVGTIQVSTVAGFGIDAGISALTGELLLVAGAIERRLQPRDYENPIERAGARFQLHAHHLKLNGVTAEKFIRRFRQVLSAPQQLV